MCKRDVTGAPLSNWQLMLVGDSVGSTQVNPTGVSAVISSVPAGNYIIKASGEYTYRPGSKGAEYSDAAYSKRAVSDAVYQTALLDPAQSIYLPWVRENNFPTSVKGWLGIIYNNALTDWGSVYNPAHIYALGTTTAATNDMTFKILDDVYSDNSGFLTVDVNKGYIGTTEDDGCVTFKDVPYDTYTADEIMKDGWTNVSGIETVVVDEPTELFTLVNNDGTEPRDPTGSIEITKYVCPASTTVVRSANGVGKTVPAGCVAQSGKAFGYVHGEQTNANAPYPELTASLTSGGTTNTLGVLTISDLPATGRYLVAETDDAGNKLGATAILGLYCEGDGDTSDNNDNQELTFVTDGGTTHCVAYNKAPLIPVDGGWSAWSPVNEQCGVTYTQTRTCTNPSPANGGAACVGESTQAYTNPACPINGGWSDWSAKDNSCGYSGVQTRTCTNPSPANGGAACVGESTQTYTNDACKYTLTTLTDGTGLGTVLGANTYTSGATATVTANPNISSYFATWGGDCSGTISPTTVLMTSPKSCTATFTLNSYLVSTSAGMGGSISPTSATVNYGSTKDFTVTAGSDYFINTVTGCSGTLLGTTYTTGVITSACTVTATFTAKTKVCTVEGAENYDRSFDELTETSDYSVCTYELTTGINETGTGSGTVLGAGIYNFGATATLTATPDSSSNFTSWGGNCSGTSSSTSLTMDSAKSCLATFTAKIVGCMDSHAKNYNASAELEGSCTYYACNDGRDNADLEDTLVDANDPACHTDGNVWNKESYNYSIDSEVNGSNVKQCSDGRDNDSDGKIDYPIDGGCSSYQDNSEHNQSYGSSTGGSVLGASTTCGIYVDKYLRKGYANNVEAVKKVQKFLNDYTDAGLTEDGIFGAGTEQALKKFQLQHADKILNPWSIAEPTGIFYLTTQTEVNNIMCPDLGLPIPTTLIPFSQNRSVPTI